MSWFVKILPILFRVLMVLGPALLGVAVHNGTVGTSSLGLVDGFLKTYGFGIAGILSLVGAERAHSSIAKSNASAVPSASPVTGNNRKQILDLLWQDIGTDGTDAEITAFKAMRDAKPKEETL